MRATEGLAIVAFVTPQQVFQCACGARRQASNVVRVLSCLQCCRAMVPESPNAFRPTPSRSIVAIATLTTQLLGAIAFALAVVWIIKQGDRQPMKLTILTLGAVGVFAGGNAHRGSVLALALCALLDVAVGVACLAKLAAVKAFVVTPLAWTAPHIGHELALATTIAGAIAVFAASACIAAIPQTRRFIAWRDEQILHVSRAGH